MMREPHAPDRGIAVLIPCRLLMLCVVLFGLRTGNAFAQTSAPLRFSEKNHDFYAIREGSGKLTHDFSVTNLGASDACVISCETDDQWEKNLRLKWDKKHFGHMEKSRITAELTPKGLHNHFHIPFRCRILAGQDTLTYTLSVRGYVYPAPNTKEERYSMQEGHLKFPNNTLSFPDMGCKEVRRDTLRFYNVWDTAMTFRTDKMPASIQVEYLTPLVQPEEEGMLVFTFHAQAMKDWGSVMERFTLITNDPIPSGRRGRKNFYVIADIYDDFASWTPEQRKNAPHLFAEEETYHFGECLSGEEIRHDFRITNIGKSNLVIHKVKTSCGCTTSKLDKEVLAPGESTYIKAIFNTTNKRGGQSKEIYLISNDPDKPKTTLIINGNIK